MSVKEKIEATNSLGCLVQALKNYRVTIDLENECILTGIVQEVDGRMNITLNEAQLINLDCYCFHYETLFVKGRSIRYIHIPKQLSVRDTILKHLKQSSRTHRVEPSTFAERFRRSKIQKYQQEIKDNITKIKESQKRLESS